MRKKMTQMKLIKKKNDYVKVHELNQEKSFFLIIFSILNIIVTCFNDLTHSEYDDIAKFMHILLMKNIFNEFEIKSYAEQLRVFFLFF